MKDPKIKGRNASGINLRMKLERRGEEGSLGDRIICFIARSLLCLKIYEKGSDLSIKCCKAKAEIENQHLLS